MPEYLVEFVETRKCFVRVEAESPELARGLVAVEGSWMDGVEYEWKKVEVVKVEED